jgi:hypothetical protein
VNRTAPQLSPDVKQAYPVATGACKGFDPLNPKGRTYANSSSSPVLPPVTEGAECARTDAIEFQNPLSLITKLPSKPRSGAFSHPEWVASQITDEKKDSRMSLFLPSCVTHLEGFPLRFVEARNNLRSRCRITTQYFVIHNLTNFYFRSMIIDYFLICIIICIT